MLHIYLIICLSRLITPLTPSVPQTHTQCVLECFTFMFFHMQPKQHVSSSTESLILVTAIECHIIRIHGRIKDQALSPYLSVESDLKGTETIKGFVRLQTHQNCRSNQILAKNCADTFRLGLCVHTLSSSW